MYPEGRSAWVVAALVILLGSVGLSAAGLAALGTPEGWGAVEASPSPSPAASVPQTPTRTPTAAPTLTPTAPPAGTPATAVPPTPTAPPEVQYVVAPGDVLQRIADAHGVALAVIAERNGLQPPYTLEVGQVLLIPVPE